MAMFGLHIKGFVLLQHDIQWTWPAVGTGQPQFNQSGQSSNSQDGCQTNSRRYDSFTTGAVWSAFPSNSWASC